MTLMDDSCLGILAAARDSVRDALGDPASWGDPGSGRRVVGIAFSGGVDSTLLAVLCRMMGYNPVLLTVGFEASHDVEFSREVAHELCMGHETYALSDVSEIASAYALAQDAMRTDNLSWLENYVAFYLISELAQKSNAGAVVTANGIDELFCGYDAYRRAMAAAGPDMRDSVVCDLMQQKLQNETRMFGLIRGMAREHRGIDILNPFLSEVFCDAARRIPLSDKIRGPEDMLRKHVIRRLAAGLGAPKTSHTKRKKALQYGSGIHKALLRLKKRGSGLGLPCGSPHAPRR